MDTTQITQIATAAAALLAPYLGKALGEVGKGTAKKAGERAWEKVENIYQTIRRKFAADKDEHAQNTLHLLEEQPTNESRQAALANILVEKAQADPAFAQELAHSVQAASQDQAVVQILNQVLPGATVEKILNFVNVGVVNID